MYFLFRARHARKGSIAGKPENSQPKRRETTIFHSETRLLDEKAMRKRKMKRYASIEIGGTKQQIAIHEEDGRILKQKTGKFPLVDGAQTVLSWIALQLPELLAEYPVEAIGVGFGGIVDSRTGKVLFSVQVPGWNDMNLKGWMEDHFHVPAVIVNDTVCGGYAELMMGSGKDIRSFFYTNIGTGIGGAMFIGGKVYDGVGYGASYFGNTVVQDPVTGNVIRLEKFCSGVAMTKRLRAETPDHSLLMKLCDGRRETLSTYHLREAAEKEDTFALRFLEEDARVYGLALANLITLLAPQRIAIGGGVANLGEVLLAPIRRYTEAYVFDSARGHYEIQQCQLMDQNVLYGAACYARDGFTAI